MGLNIPYTHSEERPSRTLLSKSSIAGAHSMLLYLLARTPEAPIVKEIKPAAAIAWKRIGAGPVLRRGHPIRLYDCPPERALDVEEALSGADGPRSELLDGSASREYSNPFTSTPAKTACSLARSSRRSPRWVRWST